MEDAKIIELQEALFGIALNAVLVGVPLDIMDRHFHPDGETRVPPWSPGYPSLLREAIEDIRIMLHTIPVMLLQRGAW